MRGVKPLPEAVRSSMRSGVVLYDLTSVVEELIFNSLDAGATKVSVFVGVGTCYVKVVDDGCGVTRDGLVLLGERYATSKSDNFTAKNAASGNFGFRGEALASISDVSLLEILTKAPGRPNGYRKVVKGCKCLYLEIDDDRKDVGTTVVVRDLFYNQPVRRTHMQSSPKKVLHSVKKCVHRIALVHSKLSFKVVDIESEDELLRTIPSPSPLTLFKTAFGVEASAGLHELNISDGKLEISGYVSGPCNSLAVKAFQYIYINSRFICKGPIHKMLNELASSFECWDPGKAVGGPQNRKRSRHQAFPTYVLNLSCPRSFYDLTFEPSKTYAEFKDWVPVLTFIHNVMKSFWKEKISDGESALHGSNVGGEHQMSVEGGIGNAVSAENLLDGDLPEPSESRKKKSWIQNYRASSDPMENLIKGDSHTSQKRHVKIPYGHIHESTVGFRGLEEKKLRIDFVHHTDHRFQSPGNHLSKSLLPETWKKESHPSISDINFFSKEDYIRESRSPTAERSSNMEESIFSSAWQDKPFKVDLGGGNGSVGSGVSYDHHEFSSDVEFTRGLIQPFLKSCSSKRFLSEGDFCTDGGIDFQNDGFGRKTRRVGCYSSAEIPDIDGDERFDCLSRTFWPKQELSGQPFTSVIPTFDLYTEFDSPSKDIMKSIPPYVNYFDGESPVMNVEKIGSSHNTFNNRWGSVTSSPLFQNTYSDFEAFSNKGAVEKCYRSVKGPTNKCFVDHEENDCRFSFDILSKSSSREHCTTDTDHGLDCNDYAVSRKFLHQHNLDGEFSPKCPDIFEDETDWSCWYSGRKDNMDITMERRQMDQFRYQDVGNNNVSVGRSKRCHSAPPFARSKTKYFTLNHPSTTTAAKTHAQTVHAAATYPEASKKNDIQQPPGGCHLNLKPSSVEDLSLDSRYEESQDIKSGASKMHEVELFEPSKCSEIPAMVPIKEFFSKNQDSMNCATKWRNCCPQITDSSKLQGLQDQSNILDISSGFLHLAADSLVPGFINKNCFKECRVLQQVDKKFIAVMAGNTLTVIDQHAADERIRLEELRKKVLSGESKTIAYLDVEQELVLPEMGYQLLQIYAKQVEEWGWICNIDSEGSGSFTRNLNLLHRQATAITLIAVPCILGVNLSESDLMEFLQQLSDTDGSSTMPPSVLRILNSKACRGAIMFGDSLLPSECSLIIEELKQTSLCFQCAHGRPTAAPLVNLEALHKQIAKIVSLNDNGPDHLWHGLRRHELSLARAEKRLSLAKS